MNKFKGWHVLGGGFVNAMLLAGASIYSFGLFVQPVEAEFGLSREQVNYGYIFFYLAMAFWAVMIGRFHNKYSAKTLSILGALGFAVGFAMIAKATSPMMMVLAILFPIGLGFTAAGPFTVNVLATRWFSRMRGRALGIAAIATSAGGFVVVPLFAKLFDQYGWRNATLIMAAAVCILVILISFTFVTSKPEDIGQFPDGAETLVEEKTVTAGDQSFIKNPAFWLIGIGTGLLLGSDQALLASLIPYGQERGFSRQDAAFVMSIMTFSAIAGKLVVSWLAERWDKRLLFALVCACNLLFLLALLMEPSYTGLLVVVGLVGLAIGGVYPVWTTITAESFGRDNFSKVIGAMNLLTVPAMVVSIGITGRTRDITGDYALAFKIFIPQVILAALIMAFVKVRQNKSGSET
ncbi:MAG: MFS transporter [Hyphomonadaceae bacterium]|nr:MFS transporter [Hyphomonadaceae bacterium]